MAFSTGKDAVILLDDFDLSAYLTEANPARDRNLPECTTFGKQSRTYVKGLKGGKLSLSGFYDGASGASQAEFDAAFDAAGGQVVTHGPVGLAIGAIVRMLLAKMSTHGVTEGVDQVVATSAEFVADGGIDAGRSLHPLSSEGATGNSASVDNGAASANGGVAHYHVTANTRNANVDHKIQHSVDDGVWADLVTFTTVGAGLTAQQRVEVAAGTTVNRYLREVHTLAAGTGAVTAATAFARR